jgi:hypothetical protein
MRLSTKQPADVTTCEVTEEQLWNFYVLRIVNLSTLIIILFVKIQGVPKICIHKVNIPYYNVYTSFLGYSIYRVLGVDWGYLQWKCWTQEYKGLLRYDISQQPYIFLLCHWALSPDDYITKAITVPSAVESNNIGGISAFATLIIYFIWSDN